jgi:hypothetical protein
MRVRDFRSRSAACGQLTCARLLAFLTLVGVALWPFAAGCASGEILAASPPSGARAAMREATGTIGPEPGVPGGATNTKSAIRSGHAAAGCDPTVAGLVADTPLRRLTNEEYENTVRDLFGLDPGAALFSGLLRDGSAGPFPSNAIGEPTDTHLLRYKQAAEQLAELVVAKLPELWPCAAPNAAADETCADGFIRSFGQRAYRRPLADAQRERLMGVFRVGSEGSGVGDGLRFVVEAILQAPNFLYHLERKPAPGETAPVAAYELAERLSYFLWRTFPDDALFAAAEAGLLATEDGLRNEAERMLADPKAARLAESFALHWLGIGNANAVQADASRYPEYKPGLGAAAQRESVRFVDYVLRDPASDHSLQTLLTADFSFPEPLLWDVYGASGPADYDQRTPLPLPGVRSGVLTQASWLMTHASDHGTAPIKRGVQVLRNVLCEPISLPADVDTTLPEQVLAGESVRERLEAATEAPRCMGCHLRINPIGFSFESFNRLGRQVPVDQFGEPVDQRGILSIGDGSVDGPIDGPKQLGDRLMRSDSGRGCMIAQVHRVAMGREEVQADTCAFVNMAQRFEAAGDDVRVLLLEMVMQKTFRWHVGT